MFHVKHFADVPVLYGVKMYRYIGIGIMLKMCRRIGMG